MKNGQRHFISEGYSMGLLIPSMILLLISIFILVANVGIGACFTLFALSLLLIKTGVEVDTTEKRIRSYKAFLNIRTGLWRSLKEASVGVVEYNRSAAIMSSRGSSNVVRSETYDLYIQYKSGRRILIHEFTNYKLARKTTKVLRAEMNLAIDDQFLEIQRNISSRKRRGGRRRR